MHLGAKFACWCHEESISSQLLSVRPQWKQEMWSLFPVTENYFFYISLGFWKNSFFTCNKPIRVLKVLTAMEEPSVAQALSRLVSGGRRRIKRMYWSIACGELQIQWAVPLGKAVLSYHVFKYFEFVFVKEHWKLVRGYKRRTHNKRINANKYTCCV